MRTTQTVGGAHFLCGHCITRHSLRYFRHSGPVIYISKLPAPSVSMPCDYRILQSPTKEHVLLVLLEAVGRSLYISIIKAKLTFPIFKTSAKSVQTTAEVCTDYS